MSTSCCVTNVSPFHYVFITFSRTTGGISTARIVNKKVSLFGEEQPLLIHDWQIVPRRLTI